MASVHVLFVYDHGEPKLLLAEEFSDAQFAASRFLEEESRHRDDLLVEVVMVSADSIETIRLSHAPYFFDAISVDREAKYAGVGFFGVPQQAASGGGVRNAASAN